MMKFFYKKESDFYIFFKNDRQILTQKKFPLLAQCENHSKKIIQQISDKKKSPYSILSLSFFSSDLDLGDRKDIILKISKFLESDTILFRNFDDTELLNIMSVCQVPRAFFLRPLSCFESKNAPQGASRPWIRHGMFHCYQYRI